MRARRPRAPSARLDGGDPPPVAAEDGRSDRGGGCAQWTRVLRWPRASGGTARRRPAAMASILSAGTAALLLLLLLQLDAYVREYQGPLDHVATSLAGPYYGLSCPRFSHDDGPRRADATRGANGTSWECRDAASEGTPFPRIFMIGARDEGEDAFGAWQAVLRGEGRNDETRRPRLERIHTLRMSNRYALSGGAVRPSDVNATRGDNPHILQKGAEKPHRLCRKVKWEHRLFAVYQTVFADLLDKYPHDDGFVIVEDDATLVNPAAFVREVCGARRLRWGFYSLYRSPLQWKGRRAASCIYEHGTVAFYVRRNIMERIVHERRRGSFCRFPIDMYISRMGPWYATRGEVVGHAGTGRIGST